MGWPPVLASEQPQALQMAVAAREAFYVLGRPRVICRWPREPGKFGFEKEIAKRMEWWAALKKRGDDAGQR